MSVKRSLTKRNILTLIGLIVSWVASAQVNTDTPNLDFSLGNFTNWKLYTGWFERDDNATYTDDDGLHEVYYYDEWTPFVWDPAYEDLQIPRISRFQAINTHSADPVLSCYNTLYTTPEGYSSAGRIGGPTLAEGKTPEGVCTEHAAAEKMEYEFEITENTVLLTCQYACALQAPEAQGENHRGPRIPYFLMSINIVDPATGDVISKATCGEFIADADSTKTGIMTRNTNICPLGSLQSTTRQSYYVYRDWTTEYIYLGDYIGQTARITLITHDCLQGLGSGHPNAGSHEAYGYFRGETQSLALTPYACGDADATITAPDMFDSYEWTRSDNIPITVDPATPYTVTIPRASITEGVIYRCKVTKGCFTTTLETELNPVVIKPGFTYQQRCLGEIAFTDTTTIENDIITLAIWDYGDGSDPDYNPSTEHSHTYQAPGNYTVKLTLQSKTGCQMERNFLVNVKAFPEISIDGTDPCSGDLNRLYLIGASSMQHWTWYKKNIAVSGSEDKTYLDDIIVSDDGLTTYRVEATDAAGCEYHAKLDITPKQLPSVYIQGDAQVCFGDALTLSAITNATTYDWMGANAHTRDLTITPTDTTEYKVIVTANNGCKDTANWVVNVLQLPILSIEGETSFCEESSTTWTASGAKTYYWQNENGSAISSTANLLVTQSGRYTVFGTDANGCKSSLPKSALTIPRPELSYSFETACIGDNYRIVLDGAFDYEWDDGSTARIRTDIVALNRNQLFTVIGREGDCESTIEVRLDFYTLPRVSITGKNEICYASTVADTLKVIGENIRRYQWQHGATGQEVHVRPSATTNYSVTATDNNGCRNSAEFLVTVLPLPTITITSRDSVCVNETVALTASGASTYLWTASNTTGAQFTSEPLTRNTRFYVTGTDSHGCTGTANRQVFVKTKPNISINGNMELCEGETFRIIAASTNATSFSWEENSEPTGLTAATYTHTADHNISLSLRGWLKGCPSDRIDTLLKVKRNPYVYYNGPTEICLGDIATFVAKGADSYEWLHNGSTDEQLSVSPMSVSTYRYTLRGTTNGCSSDTVISLKVQALPNFAIEGATEYCLNEQIRLQAVSDEIYSYNWKDYGSGAEYHDYPASSGTFSYEVTATDTKQCQSTKKVNVRVKPLPDVTLTGINEVCVGETFRITANNAQTYTWHNGSTAESLSFVATKDSLVSVTGCSNGCCAKDQMQLTAKQNPQVTINGKERICSGDLVTLTASGLGNLLYNWSHGPTNASITEALFSDNTYRVTATAENGCTGTDQFTVRVDTLPTIRINGPGSMCYGENATWQATGAQSYTWERGSNQEFSGDSYYISTGVTNTYTVLGVDGNGCQNTAQKTMVVIPLPNLTYSGNTIMCKGDTFHIAVQGADTYLWQNQSDSATFTYVAARDTLCRVVGTKNGCSNSIEIQLYSLENPYVTITGEKAICAGDTTTLEANGADIYRWFDESTEDYNIVTTRQPTTYSVTGYNIYADYGGKQCKGVARFDLNVHPLPDVVILGPESVCEGTPIELSATGDPVESYLWEDRTAGTTHTIYDATVLSGIETVHTFTATGTDSHNCSFTTEKNVTVYAYPTVDYIGRTDLCYGDSILLTMTGNSESYYWTHNESTIGFLAELAESKTSYYVEGTLNGCTTPLTIPITIRPLPIVNIEGESEICAGEDITLTASGAATYRWNTFNSDQTASITVRPYDQHTTYTVRGYSEYGCLTTKSKDVTVNPLPKVKASGPVTTCYGDVVNVVAEGNAYGYSWDTGDVGAVIQPTINTVSTFTVTAITDKNCTATDSWTVSPVEDPELDFGGETLVCVGDTIRLIGQGATTYLWPDGSIGAQYSQVMEETTDIVMYGTKQNCTKSLVIHIEAMSKPNLMVTGPTAVCRNHEFTLTAAGAKSFSWNTGEQTESMTTHINVPSTFTVTGRSGSCVASMQVPVEILPAPKTLLRFDEFSVCPGREDSVMLSVSGASTYEWRSVPESNVIASNQANRLRATVSGPTWIYVTGYSEYGCEQADSVYIGELPDPVFSFEVDPNWIEEESSTVRFMGISPDLGSTWYWDAGDRTPEAIGQTISHTYEMDNVDEAFTVNVLAIDKYGCRFTGEAPIYAWKEFWAPNAFTPNGDGTNDTFRFFGGRYVTSFKFIIYNRLGEIVYTGESMEDTWDGTFEGKACPWGVYGWVVQYECDAEGLKKEGTRKGHVNLVR